MGGGGSSPIRPHPSGTPSAKKTKGSSAALLSASHRTGPRASAPAPGNLPMKREGRRTNQSVCPPAITPFPPVIPGTSLPSRNQSRRASMQLSPSRSHPGRKAGPSHRSGRSTSWKLAKTSPPSRPIPRRIPGHPQPRGRTHMPGLQCNRSGRSRFRGSEPAPLRPLQGVLPCLVGFVAPNALQFR